MAVSWYRIEAGIANARGGKLRVENERQGTGKHVPRLVLYAPEYSHKVE
jgi:hypothetical protein